jgi:hypothetical protein
MAAIVADVRDDDPNGDCGVAKPRSSSMRALRRHLTILGGRPAQRHFDLYLDCTADYQRMDASALAL